MARTATRQAAIKANRALRLREDEEAARDEANEGDWRDEENYAAPPAKRTRASIRGGRNTAKGSLRGILALPLETVTSICLSLDLETLFHLSRLNKRFWRFLRDTVVKYVWEEVRTATGVPELQLPGLSVYGLANLLYGRCIGCGTEKSKADYTLRIRCCTRCLCQFVYNKKVKDPLWPKIQSLVTPSKYEEHDQPRIDAVYCKNEVDTISRIYRKFETKNTVTLNSNASPRAQPGPKAKRSVKSQETHNPRKEQKMVPVEFEGMGTFGKDLFLARVKANRAKRERDAAQIASWQKEVIKEKERVAEQIRRRRQLTIENRFKESGWKDYHFDATFRAHSSMRIAEDLDEPTWAAIKPGLELLLRQHKASSEAAHLARDVDRRKAVVYKQYSALLFDTETGKKVGFHPLPPWDEFATLQSVQQLWTLSSIKDVSRKEPILLNNPKGIAKELEELRTALQNLLFDQIVGCLAAIDQAQTDADKKKDVEKRTSKRRRAGLVPVSSLAGKSFSLNQKEELFLRAVFVVRCLRCTMVDSVLRLAGHTCSRSYYDPSSGQAQPSILAMSYSAAQFTVQAAVDMVLAAGKTASVSAQEMEELGPVFTCEGTPCANSSSSTGHSFFQMLAHVIAWHNDQIPQRPPAKLICETKEAVMDRLYKSVASSFFFPGL
ncbi:hypothetical protein JCM11251_005823 [Rhodosporidiobolus azoricus]